VRRRSAAGAALLCAVWAAGLSCGDGSPRIWLERGSPAAAPIFGFSLGEEIAEPFLLGTFQVHSCESVVNARSRSWVPPRERAAWYVDWWPRDSRHPPPEVRRVTYGTVPRGMTEDRPAEPLDAGGGCYLVQAISAAGAGGAKGLRTGFRTDATGSPRELTSAQIDSIVKMPRGRS
jgi:hypothetical protein